MQRRDSEGQRRALDVFLILYNEDGLCTDRIHKSDLRTGIVNSSEYWPLRQKIVFELVFSLGLVVAQPTRSSSRKQ